MSDTNATAAQKLFTEVPSRPTAQHRRHRCCHKHHRHYRRRQQTSDVLSRHQDLLFLVLQHLRTGQIQTTNSRQSSYEFSTIHRPHSTATSVTITTTTTGRVHDLVQDAFSKICRVNRAWARTAIPFLWSSPRIRTSHQLDRFVYTLEHHGHRYIDLIQELVVRQGDNHDLHSENLWWGHARCRAILSKLTQKPTRLHSLDCNWAGSPFDQPMVKSLSPASFGALKRLRLEPVQMPSLAKCLDENHLNLLISACVGLESLEFDSGYEVSNRSMLNVLVSCPNLRHLVVPSHCIVGFSDGIEMGYGDSLTSVKIYPIQQETISQDVIQYQWSFRKGILPNLQSLSLDLPHGHNEFLHALFSRPTLPLLTSLRIMHPSDNVLRVLADRLAPQLTHFESRLRADVNSEILKRFSSRLTALQSLDCCPGSVLGFLGRNITTLSANSSLLLFDGIAEQCPNLQDLTLWGGSLSRQRHSMIRTGTDPESGLIYVLEMCPLRRLRLVNAYLGLGPRFWAACAELGTKLTVIDIELFDCKGLNTWGLFESIKKCKQLQWLRLTELIAPQKEVMLSSLIELQGLCALYLSIPERGSFTISMAEIASFLACFPELFEVGLRVPKPWPNSATTTPRTSLNMEEQISSNALLALKNNKHLKIEPTMTFKNAANQKIHGTVEWSVPQLGF